MIPLLFPKIQQPVRGYRYSIDSFLLADFCEIPKNVRILELGSGSGIISFLLLLKFMDIEINAIEIQEDLHVLAKKNMSLFSDSKRINFIRGDISHILDYFSPNSFDYVISNPPYYNMGSGRLNKYPEKSNARHEIISDIDIFIMAGRKVLKNKGVFFLIFTAKRLKELLFKLASNNIEPKLLRCVHSNDKSEAKLVLIKAIKMGNPGLKIIPPIFIDRFIKENRLNCQNITLNGF